MRHGVRVALLALAVQSTAHGQSMETGFLNRTISADGRTRAYQVYVPAGYDGTRAWPVILFLHGAGERGDDGLLQTEVGLPGAIRRNADRYPAIVVMPQVPQDSSWLGGASTTALAALDRTLGEFSTDRARVYLAGLSMGGSGAWSLAHHHPERFAALVVVCGFTSPRGPFPSVLPGDTLTQPERIAARIRGIPTWIVHGAADPVVPVEESRRMNGALQAAGGVVTYVELPGVGHNAWDPAFDDPELVAWLFAQARK
jgi:predicted peptidase